MAAPSHKGSLLAINVLTGFSAGCLFLYFTTMMFTFTKYGMDTVTFGYMQSFMACIQLFMAPVIGKCADKLGTRTVMIFCLATGFLSHFFLGIASGLFVCVLSRLVGVFQDTFPVTQILVTDLVPEKDRGEALGKCTVALSMGLIFGPLLGGIIGERLGNQDTHLIACCLPLVCIIGVLATIPANTRTVDTTEVRDKDESKEAISSWEKHKSLILGEDIVYILACRAICMLPDMMFLVNFPIIGSEIFKLSPQEQGMWMACTGVITMFSYGFMVGPITKRVSMEQILLLTPIYQFFSNMVYTQLSSIVGVYLLMIPSTALTAALDNTTMTKLTSSVPKEDTGTIVGISSSVFLITQIITPALGGLILTTVGWPGIGQYGMLTALSMATMVFLKQRRHTTKGQDEIKKDL